MEFTPIGFVESCYPDKFGTPRQAGLVPQARAFIRISKNFQPEESLQGLEGFSHLWVIFIFHKNQSQKFHAKIHPPRMLGGKIGVFATRSPHRPNPIGLSLVEVERIEKEGVWVLGVDLIEGTPVLDIKPYLPFVEAKPLAKGGWADRPAPELVIRWEDSTLQKLTAHYPDAKTMSEVKLLIEESIKLDPRPVVYRGFEGSESPYRSEHAMRVYNLDVHFRFLSETAVEIFDLREWQSPHAGDENYHASDT